MPLLKTIFNEKRLKKRYPAHDPYRPGLSFLGELSGRQAMVAAGVDLMELQIPFSEPMADGPVILRANQKALDRG